MTKNSKLTNFINTVNEISTIARDKEIAHLFTQNEVLNGRTLTLKGREHVNFGSCSYLGLELDDRLIQSSIVALKKFGTQFSSSRTYVSISLYEELEELLNKIFKKPVVLSSCTSLGHQAVIPIIIEDNELIILDQQAHISMREACERLVARGVAIKTIKHNNLVQLEEILSENKGKHDRVWYFADGVYSMYGDLAPIDPMLKLLNKYKELFLYIDDAHGMSWTGEHGSGYILSKTFQHDRMVLTTSLAKGFASAGGVFIFPNEQMYWKVKNWGGALTYSGPQQPAVLGASIESAKIHLSPEIYELQNSLSEKISFTNEIFNHYQLPLIAHTRGPIFYIGVGLPKVGFNLVKRLSEEGFYTNIGVLPAVPSTCTGIRMTITNHLKLEDIEALAERINYHLPKALKEEDRTIDDVKKGFRSLTQKRVLKFPSESSLDISINEDSMKCEYYNSIKSIDQKIWDNYFGDGNFMDWEALIFLEDVFNNTTTIEDKWNFHYWIIKDFNGKIILATFFTSLLTKDDMLAPSNISVQVEKEREKNPYYLTSKTMIMGSILSEGKHLFLDTNFARWKDAFMMLLNSVWKLQEMEGINNIILRDFEDNNPAFNDFLIFNGFEKVIMPDTHILENTSHLTREIFINELGHKKRNQLRSNVLKLESNFRVEISTQKTEEKIGLWYKLCRNVQRNNLEINNFQLPYKLFEKMAGNEDWDVIELYLKVQEKDELVAVGFAYKGRSYCPLLIGMNYDYLKDFKIYKQMLFQTVLRGFGYKNIHLGLTASLEKRKMGAKRVQHVGFVQVKDSYNLSQISLISNNKVKYPDVKL